MASGKIRVLANPVDLDKLRSPANFDRWACRESLGCTAEDVLLAFVALGHFERKGLPLLLEALGVAKNSKLKAIILGGSQSDIDEYRGRANRIGLNGHVKFVPTQKDVRPYLWAADALVLPSYYEVFPLVALEAAAAGLPLLVTPLNGVEEFLRDGENGLLMQRSISGVTDCIARFARMTVASRRSMGQRAQMDVNRYGLAEFVSGWSKLYAEAAGNAG
jgi:glycosyltransferase involved in cell wall biosynthesis